MRRLTHPDQPLHFVLSQKHKAAIFELIAYLFVLLFVYTAMSKLTTHDTFIKVLSKYPLIRNYAGLIAVLVPVSELIVSLLLIVPQTKWWGMLSSFLLLSFFLAYILFMFISGSDLPCSCGGLVARLSWHQHVWFNSVLILLASLGLVLYKK